MAIEKLNEHYPELGAKLSKHLSNDFEHRALIDLVVERYPTLIIELGRLEVVPGFVYEFYQELVEFEKSRNEQKQGYHWDRDRITHSYALLCRFIAISKTPMKLLNLMSQAGWTLHDKVFYPTL